LDGPVNKRDLSTEKPENLEEKTWGPCPTLGLTALSQEITFPTGKNSSNKCLQNVWDIGTAKNGCCQPKRGFELVPEGGGSPKTMVSNGLSSP